MKEKTHGLILTLVFAVFISFITNAQNNFGSEKELRKQADGLFKDDDYAAALPLYSQLLSLYPKDPNFNYKYGVCLLYAKENKEKPLPYLMFAVGKEDVDDDIYYHLGKAYHLNYRFDDAIAQYTIFKQKKSKTSTKLEVDLQIRQCENGKNLLKNVTDLTVIERKEMNSSEYFRAYDLTKIGAKLVVKPDDLKTPFDVKKKEQSTVVIRQTSQDIYYSSYGVDGKNGRDIYKISKLPNFTWGQPVNLGPNINTMYDEDFPYITPDGKTLYFCSKGHNSMGGYDVFKSELNPSGEWNKPQNLDFAINTPDDDIQYVTDAESDFAYFSSKRNSADGRIVIFKIKTERVPVTAAIIKGKVLSDALPTNLAAKISIKNVQTGKFIGTFNSSDKDGKYRLNLSNGTKYEFTVEQSGTPPITQVVDIPPMKELRPLKQEIQLKKKDGSTTMIIYNFFSDTVENNALATAELFKERANLDVNYDEQIQAGIISEASSKTAGDPKNLANRNAYQENSAQGNTEAEKQNNTNTTAAQTENSANEKGKTEENSTTAAGKKSEKGINNAEIVTIAKEDAKDTQKEADDLRDKSRQAYAFANLKNNAAQKKYKDATDAESAANATADIGEKQLQLDVASKAKKDGDNLAQQAVVAYNLAKDMEIEADAKQQEANQSEQYANELEVAVKSNSADALEKLEKQSRELEKNQTPAKASSPDNLVKQAQEKNTEAARLEERKNDLKAEIQESMFDEKIAREDILKAKTDSAKTTNEAKLKTVLDGKKEKETELAGIDSRVSKLKEEAIVLEEEAKINKEILSEISNSGSANLGELAQEDKQKLDAQFSAQRAATNNSTATSPPVNNNQTASKTNESKTQNTDVNKNVPVSTGVEDYTAYANSYDDNKRELLAAQAQVMTEKSDSVAKLISKATEGNEINTLTNQQKNYKEIADAKKLASEVIAYNVYNKEYEANKNALNQKLQSIPETDKANFSNSLSQIDGDYQKAATTKENALQQTSIAEKEANLNTAINAQNVVLVRQRKLLEQANSSIANNNKQNKATSDFKGFNTDRNSSVTEAVNNLRPDYSNYKTSLQLSEEEAIKVKQSAEYLQFEAILNSAVAFEKSADEKATQFKTTKSQGEEKVIESQQLIDLAAEEKKKSKKQALAEEAIRIDNEGRDLLTKADTIKVKAQSEMLKSAATKAEADKFIAKLDRAQQEKIMAVYQNQVVAPGADVASNQTQTNTQENQQANTAKQENNNTSANEAQNSKQSSTVAQNNNTAVATPKVKDKESILREIKATSDYKGYAEIKDAAEALKTSAAAMRTEADSLKVQAQRDAMNSNDLFEFAAAQSNKKDRKEAQLKAEEMDKVSKENEAKADSMKTGAEKAETNARMKQYEADNYLRKFDETKSKTLLMAYNNVVSDEMLKAENDALATNANAKTNEVAANNAQPNNQKTNASNQNSKTQANQNKTNQNTTGAQNNQQQNKNTATSTSEVNVDNNQTPQPVVVVKPPKPDVKTTPEYTKYISLKQEAEQATAEAAAWKQRVDSTKALSAQKLEESNNKLEEASALKKRKRKPLVKEAAELDYEAQMLMRAADSLTVFANEANKKANDKKATSDGYLSTIDKELSLRIMRSIQGIPDPVEVETVVVAQENNGNEAQKSGAFVAVGIQKGKPHNAGNPIKMNEPLPDGIVFKVQIGAFNKPVAENAFGTVSPVSGETIANSNLIRYTAGLFGAFEDAASAKKELNGLNYKDAFVVAYCYGKRMSVTEARALIAAGKDCKTGGAASPNQNVLAKNNSGKTTTELNNSTANNAEANPNLNAPSQIKAGEILPQQDIQVIKGLLYTVQVGVYSKPVKAGQLYNITPLYYELNQKGQYRYTSGIFNDVREASKAKNTIVQIGVADAFVTAYINGKRIPMEQAAAMEAQQGKSAFAQVPGVNVQPKVIPLAGAIESRKAVAEEPKNGTPKTPVVAANIVYKVQLGAFRNEVPVEIMNKYLTIADKGIANFKSGDLTIYTVGNYSNAAAAEAVKAEVIAKGITDAFVIALNNGEKISLEEAKQLGGK